MSNVPFDPPAGTGYASHLSEVGAQIKLIVRRKAPATRVLRIAGVPVTDEMSCAVSVIAAHFSNVILPWPGGTPARRLRRSDMTNSKLKFGFPLALVLATASAAAVANGACDDGKCSGDAQLKSTIQTSLDQHPALGPPNSIKVQTRAGVVYLYGQVGEGMQRYMAESIAKQTPGVARVVDSIYISR
jgi:hypothetical protein